MGCSGAPTGVWEDEPNPDTHRWLGDGEGAKEKATRGQSVGEGRRRAGKQSKTRSLRLSKLYRKKSVPNSRLGEVAGTPGKAFFKFACGDRMEESQRSAFSFLNKTLY